MTRKFSTIFLALFLPLAIRAQQANYTVSSFPPNFEVLAINSSGQAVGYAGSSSFTGVRAALYSNGQLTILGALPGGDSSEATAINSSGQIVGDSRRGDGTTHPFLYANGQMTDLGTLPGGFTGYATGINDSGVIVGWSDTKRPGTSYPQPDHAFKYSGGQMTDLGNLSAAKNFVNFSHALAINNAGQIVGWSITDTFDTHAFRFDGGQMVDLGTLGGSAGRATAINGSGDIAGYSYTANDSASHAFLVPSGGSMSDLGTISGNNNSYATGINSARQIIGYSSSGSGAPPFIYSPSTGIQNLNNFVDSSQFHLTFPRGINDVGQIVSQGSNADFSADALLLTPPASNSIRFANISTRLNVLTGDNALIGGFIITGSAPKKVMLRAIGPSLPVAGALADSTLELHFPDGSVISNDNWRINDQTGQSQEALIVATTIPPTNDLESALVQTLAPGAYTAIVRGKNGGTGVGLVEAYDLDQATLSKLANISTRGFVDVGNNVMIGGFILVGGNGGSKVMVRAIGPSLPVPGALADPTLELHNGNGTKVASNDNWKDTQQAEIQATGIPPSNDLESAIVTTLPAGAYTAIVAGKGGTTGVGLVEVYNLQ